MTLFALWKMNLQLLVHIAETTTFVRQMELHNHGLSSAAHLKARVLQFQLDVHKTVSGLYQ